MICKHVGKSEESSIIINESIVLTEKEEELFSKVLAVVAHFQLKTVVRVAGGWVRDKLLSKESIDIDFALDNCTGLFFAEKLAEYLELSTKIGSSRKTQRRVNI